MPRRSQILMRLNSLKSRAMIRHIVVTASYQDATGHHEMNLEDLKVSPFMVVRNGEHRVHISAMQDVEK